MNPRTEKAIKAWLALPLDNRGIRANTKGQITLLSGYTSWNRRLN